MKCRRKEKDWEMQPGRFANNPECGAKETVKRMEERTGKLKEERKQIKQDLKIRWSMNSLGETSHQSSLEESDGYGPSRKNNVSNRKNIKLSQQKEGRVMARQSRGRFTRSAGYVKKNNMKEKRPSDKPSGGEEHPLDKAQGSNREKIEWLGKGSTKANRQAEDRMATRQSRKTRQGGKSCRRRRHGKQEAK